MNHLILIITLLALSLSANADETDTLEFLQWSQSHREMYQSNKKHIKRLLKKSHRGEIIGLELIIASKSDIRIESKFGHALIY